MTAYEYQVVPAPERGLKIRGIKTPEARFAYVLQQLMNKMAKDGWEYQRAETLPSVERSGLRSTTTRFRNLLVFRRPRSEDPVAPASVLLEDLTESIEETETETPEASNDETDEGKPPDKSE